MSNFPIFPKIGQHVRFDKVYTVYDYRNQVTSDINIGEIAEVVHVEIPVGSQELGNYLIYLGLKDGHVARMDYTVHKQSITIIPSTTAGQVLYGNK
jgi:hypothetical protein